MAVAFPGAPKRKGFIARHRILSTILGLLLLSWLVGQCVPDEEITAPEPAAVTTTSPAEPEPAPVPSSTQPTTAPTRSAAEKAAAAKKAAEEKRKAAAAAKAEAKRKAAVEKAAKEKAAKKRAAKKRATERRAAEERAAEREAEAERRAAEEEAREEAALTFDNCEDMNRTYPHGVGRPGAEDETNGTPPVTNFKTSSKIYNLNSGSDRDGDGIACEKL